jgi:CRP-like cAMP-binding protein
MDGQSPLLDPILTHARRKQIAKGQVILYEGDMTVDVFVLESGIVKIHDIDETGNEKILHLLKRPAVFPFAFFSGNEIPTRWFYTALTDSEINIIPREILANEIETNSKLSLYLMNQFSLEVHEILTRLSSLGKTNTRDKLIAALNFLVVWHSKQWRDDWYRVSFPVSHQLLADMIGITRESTAIAMKELQNEGMVRNPRLTILEINRSKIN